MSLYITIVATMAVPPSNPNISPAINISEKNAHLILGFIFNASVPPIYTIAIDHMVLIIMLSI